jgi:hypothetical protein
MGANTMASAARILFSWALLFPQFLASQMPQPLGKLHMTSTTPGASITINGVRRKEQTPVTLAASPGDYKVLIGSCQEQTAHVSAGQITNVDCAK